MKRYNWKQQNKLAIQKQLLLMHYVIIHVPLAKSQRQIISI